MYSIPENSSREYIIEALRTYGPTLKVLSEDLRSDREIVIEAIQEDGRALEFASKDLRSDRQIVLEAVRKIGVSLKYASRHLQSDREIGPRSRSDLHHCRVRAGLPYLLAATMQHKSSAPQGVLVAGAADKVLRCQRPTPRVDRRRRP